MSAINEQEMAQIPAPPSYSAQRGGKYSPVPQSGDAYHPAPAAGPVGYSQPQPYPGQPPMMAPQGGYAPAPPVMGQQSSSNVVVVSQPSAAPAAIVIHSRPRAATYLTLTLVMMVLCFIHGNILAFICLIPALIFAIVATGHNDSERYEEAKRFGHLALGCNIAMFVKYGVLILIGIILVIVYFTVWAKAVDDIVHTCTTQCDYFNNCHVVCNN